MPDSTINNPYRVAEVPYSNNITFYDSRLVIKPTETGFEAIVGEGFTIDDATKAFVDALNHYMKDLKL